MGLYSRCLEILAEKPDEKQKRAEQRFGIIKKLTSAEYKNLLFPLTMLKNFTTTTAMKKKLEEVGNVFPVSVNAMTFFNMAVANVLLRSDITFDGSQLVIAVDSAMREEKEQKKLIENAKPEDRYKFASKSPHSNGSAIDYVLMKKTDKGLVVVSKTKDLLKDQDGNWLLGYRQDGIKKNYFVLDDQNFFDEWLKYFEETEWYEDAKTIIAEFRNRDKPWESSHVKLTELAKHDPTAVEALYNIRWCDRFWGGMPYSIIINDENWHVQLPRYLENCFSLTTMEEFKKQNQTEMEEKAREIIQLAEKMVNEIIYHKHEIIPGHRLALSREVEGENASILGLISSLGEGRKVIPNTPKPWCSKKSYLGYLREIEQEKQAAIAYAKQKYDASIFSMAREFYLSRQR